MVVFSPPSKLPSLAWLPTVVRVPYSAPKALLWHVAPQTRYAFVQHCIELRSHPNVDTRHHLVRQGHTCLGMLPIKAQAMIEGIAFHATVQCKIKGYL